MTRSTRRRMLLSTVATLAVIGVFVVRLVDIQIVQADAFNTESAGKRSVATTVYGQRGDIVDANGTVLAGSIMRYDITASPRNSAVSAKYTEQERTNDIQAVADAAGLTPAEVRTKLDTALAKNPESDYALLASKVTLEVRDAVRAAQKATTIGWVYTQPHPARSYPLGSVAGSLVGFMGADAAQFGLERSENACLAATNGSSTYERSLDGVQLPGSEVVDRPAKNGGTLKLTIVSDLNWFAQQAITRSAQSLQAKWATAVVVRVKDGHLMAVADYPSVDPNDVNASDPDDIRSTSFATSYEPGSTLKAMTAAMLIDQGKATPYTRVTVPGIFNTRGGYIKDVFAHGTMNWTLTGIMVNSSNIGISELTDRVSKQKRYEYMLKFGLGKKTEVGFNGEASGQLAPADKWDNLTNYAVSFGQGVAATSAQVASIYQTLGNGGVRMPLTLVEGCEQPDGTVTDVPTGSGERVVSTKAANTVVNMLENFVTQASMSPLVTIPGYDLAAKSGTAQVAKPGGGYGNDRVTSIAGLVSGDDPQYAIVVTMGMPQTNKASSAVAPVWHDIAEQVIKTFRVKPSTKPVPTLPVSW
ncbi:penicillin-binding protein 2 [Galbitalea sp. SE-J8]|uniref:peptidoglycan D,D-transpeptidase FtsI family protein n=1 Tax=Galbitalea sp. SE-J8 TaxID=3054952 RepID=UPI00259CADF9|nr:penicillin-binding protein 2 [Galbitalea sp. SE-J8]MDM4763080.1 penicillin-binding protein 2 [Galbitalea sp. SE-J8]